MKDVLDRTGFTPEDKVNLAVTRPDEDYDQMVKRFRELTAKLEPTDGARVTMAELEELAALQRRNAPHRSPLFATHFKDR